MMTQKITTDKEARYLVPGETLITKQQGRLVVEDVTKLGAGTYEITTDEGTWVVDGGRKVTVETTDELDPFAGIPSADPLDHVDQPERIDNATEKQRNFIASLREERDLPPHEGPLSKREASDEITRLLAMPKAAPGSLPDEMGEAEGAVPAGRYSVDKADGSGSVFYQVDRPTEGRWAGYTFVKLLLGAPGDWRRERVNRRDVAGILSRIAADGPREASLRFGLEAGVCGVCGSPLSNEESRALGIGPVCREKAGW